MDSVHAQDYDNVEYIIIDGASTDGTQEIIRQSLKEEDVFISEPDEGLYYALNKGIQKATGDIVGILHADDLFTDAHVISDVMKLMSHCDADLCYSDLHYVERENPDKVVRNWVAGEYEGGQFLKGWMPPHPTVWVKKSIFDKYGMYDTEFKTAADYEWLLRTIHKHKVRIVYLPRVTVKMRVGGKSNITLINRLKANREDRKAWTKNGLKPQPFTLLFKPLSKIRQYFS